MRLKPEKTSRGAVIFLVLFALPFAGVGTGAAYLSGSMLIDWWQARSWVEVPARVLTADLIESRGDSTTYRVEASYEYSFRGETYRSDRVRFGFGSDNIGSFHQDAYQELRGHLESGRDFRCFVDSNRPHEAVLYRQLRWGLLGLQTIFALAFGLVGYGLMFVAWYGGGAVNEASRLRQMAPDRPWRWRQDWIDGRIESGTGSKVVGGAVFAVLWNLISAPVLFFLPEELAAGNRLALLALVFPFVGILLASWTGYAFLQWRRYGNSVFVLGTNPGVLGGELTGTIETRMRGPAPDGVTVILSCSRTETSGSGKDRRSHNEVLWQDSVVVPGTTLGQGPNGMTIPIQFTIPYAAGPATDSEASRPVHWQLEAEAERTGIDFGARFRVPVFKTSTSDPSVTSPTAGRSAAATEPSVDLQALGIDAAVDADGGWSYRFRRARAKGAAVGVTLFTTIWLGFLWLMVTLGAPVIFPILFGLFALLMIAFGVDLWLRETRVHVARGVLTFTRRLLGRGRRYAFQADEITALRPVSGMQANNTLYYRIELETAGGDKHYLASQLGTQRLARYLVGRMQEALDPQ